MAVIQCKFNISEESMNRLITGEYTRIGGVIRNNAGQIVEFLKDAPNNTNNNLKYGLIGIGIFAVGGLTVTAFNKYKEYKKNKGTSVFSDLEQEIIIKHNTIITDYLNSINSGTLDIETLKKLINNLKTIKEEKELNNLKIKIDVQKTNELFNMVYKYTIDLAKLNNINLNMEEIKNEFSLDNTIKCLEYQEQIFETDCLEKDVVCIENE